jgi:hypothetical protein
MRFRDAYVAGFLAGACFVVILFAIADRLAA